MGAAGTGRRCVEDAGPSLEYAEPEGDGDASGIARPWIMTETPTPCRSSSSWRRRSRFSASKSSMRRCWRSSQTDICS